MRSFMTKSSIALVLLLALTISSNVLAEEAKFAWCQADVRGGTSSVLYFSEAFEYKGTPDETSYANAFEDYIGSHYSSRPTTASCTIGVETASDARAQRDSEAAEERRRGNRVVFTNWTN
jgi:hypothetical protein